MQDFYTSIEDAKIEIQKRWQDENLKDRVRAYLGGEIPEPFLYAPRAVLFRQICIPGSETIHFLEISKKMDLDPLNLEYLEDKFCTRNPDKLQYGRIDVCEKMNKNNEPIIRSTKIINFPANDNKPLKEVKTVWNQDIVSFFHESFDYLDVEKPEIVDFSQWFQNNGPRASEYYKKLFALFCVYGVLCENFGTDGEDENDFFGSVVHPSFLDACEQFGIKPLVVQIFTNEEVARCDQWYFKSEMQNLLNERMI